MNRKDLIGMLSHDWSDDFAQVEYLRYKAVMAVVELHKPEQRCYDATCYCKDMCSKCKEDYPCSTIQAIEKVLV